jgi:hypothetical protein
MLINVDLLAGSNYMVVGFCGPRCSNLDLVLMDGSGEELQKDGLPDAEPMLALTPEASGPFQLRVAMVECTLSRCPLAVGIMGRSGEAGIPPGEDMDGRLAIFASELEAQGFSELGRARRGTLGTQQTLSLPFTTETGLEYRIAGVCDADCFDLDLVLRDDAGRVVASDLLDDPFPILAFRPDSALDHDLEVSMTACALEPCRFRLAAFARSLEVGPGGTTLSGELLFHDTWNGELSDTDEEMGGANVDVYEVEARPGQRIILDLRSHEFNTLLRLFDPEGGGSENDDYGPEAGHSHLELLTLLEGVYTIHVTSHGPGEVGQYRLQIAVVE